MNSKIITAVAILSLVTGCAPSDKSTATDTVLTLPPVAASKPVSVDERLVVNLTDLQRDHVLTQMRTMLDSTQQIVEGLAEGDLKQIEEAAYVSGFKLSQTPEHRAEMGGLQMNKALPREFRQMSKTTRMMFDEVADMAARGESVQDIQRVFADGMHGCNACHVTFQIPTP